MYRKLHDKKGGLAVMYKKTLTIFISLFIFFAGEYIIKEKGGSTMAMSRPLEAYNKDIPKIDMDPPAATETATFALG